MIQAKKLLGNLVIITLLLLVGCTASNTQMTIFSITTRAFAETSDEGSGRAVTDMSILFGGNAHAGVLSPLDKRQEGNTLKVTFAPFSSSDSRQEQHGRIDIYAVLYDQFGDEMWEEDVVWHISCSLNREVLYDIYEWDHMGFALISMYTDIIARVITVTAASYSNPLVYTTIEATVDPNRANIIESWPHEGRLFGGSLSQLTVPFNFINTPDGTYAASLTASPIEEYGGLPRIHNFSGLRIKGWQTQDLEAFGNISVVDGIGRITFTSYDTPVSYNSYWTLMTLNVDIGELGTLSTVLQIEFSPILEPPPPPAIVEIEILRDNATVLPGYGTIYTIVRAYDELGQELWPRKGEGIIWSANGLSDDDFVSWDNNRNHFIHIGASQYIRVITITVSYANNPEVYDSIEITVNPDFIQKADEILFAHPQLGIFDEIVYSFLPIPSNSAAWIHALALDQYGLEMPLDDLIWTIDSEVDTDKIAMFSNGFILYVGADEIEREITVTAASRYEPELHAAFIIYVYPSLPTLGMRAILKTHKP